MKRILLFVTALTLIGCTNFRAEEAALKAQCLDGSDQACTLYTVDVDRRQRQSEALLKTGVILMAEPNVGVIW